MPLHNSVLFPDPISGMEEVNTKYLMRRRFEDWLNPPHVCDACGCEVVLVPNKSIYGRAFGKWPFAYQCQSTICAAYVGLHPHSLFPLGKMADKPTRDLRQQVHELIDPMWAGNEQRKTEVYQWLANLMELPLAKCHVSHFDLVTCLRALTLIEQTKPKQAQQEFDF